MLQKGFPGQPLSYARKNGQKRREGKLWPIRQAESTERNKRVSVSTEIIFISYIVCVKALSEFNDDVWKWGFGISALTMLSLTRTVRGWIGRMRPIACPPEFVSLPCKKLYMHWVLCTFMSGDALINWRVVSTHSNVPSTTRTYANDDLLGHKIGWERQSAELWHKFRTRFHAHPIQATTSC